MTESMYNAFRSALVIKTDYLLSNSDVFQEIIPREPVSIQSGNLLYSSSLTMERSCGMVFDIIQFNPDRAV
jgi:hypothetical protein